MTLYDKLQRNILKTQKDQTKEQDKSQGFFKMLHKARQDGKAYNNKDLLGKLASEQPDKKTIAAGAAFATVDFASQIFEGLKNVLFHAWSYIDEKVLPTQSRFNKELGGTQSALGGINKQAMSMGHQFWHLGLPFEQGVDAVKNIASAMQTVNIPTKALQTVVKLSEYVGVGAEQAGKLANQYASANGNLENLAIRN